MTEAFDAQNPNRRQCRRSAEIGLNWLSRVLPPDFYSGTTEPFGRSQ
jgi:hypothetical protein